MSLVIRLVVIGLARKRSLSASRPSDQARSGQGNCVSAAHALLTSRVRYVLQRAGFCLVDRADDAAPGMRVSEIPSGVLVRWTALGGTAGLYGSHDIETSTGSIVRAAVTAVLADAGHFVMSSGAAGDLIVLPGDQIQFHTP
ncbi:MULTISPECIES: hypothetical protein [Streptomyces]|uniref:hypothetical protein n=1 Tax=Streptomyces TaxID=1883 RepID=UPI00131CFDE5|nr:MULTISPECIES: hypothetical protein [Streptomyces]